MPTTNNQQIRALAQQIYALTDDPQIHQWAQSIYDASPDPVPEPQPTPAPPATVVPALVLYEHDNYGGRSISMEGAHANLAGVFQDQASSAIAIGAWEVFSDANFSGRRVVLEDGRYPSLRPFNINDAISSCRPLVPVKAAAKERKEFFYFTANRGDLAEVRDHVTAVWDHCWGDPPNSTAQLRAAQMPAIGEFAQCVFTGQQYRGDAEGTLRAMFDAYLQDDVLRFLAKLYIDEPSIPYSVMARGVEAVRKVAASYADLSRLRMMVCFGDGGAGREDYYCADLFDDIATDAYGERASIVTPGGRMDRLIGRIRSDQRVYPVPGVVTDVGALSGDEFDSVVQYAFDQPQCGGVMPFTWFDRPDVGGRGARSNELRDRCINAGRRFIAWNTTLQT